MQPGQTSRLSVVTRPMGWLSAKLGGKAFKAGLLRFFHNKSPYPQVMVTTVPFWTLEPAASLWLCTVPALSPAT